MKKFFYRTLTLNSIFLMLITAVLALIFFLGYDMFFQFSPTGALINDNTLIIIDSGHGGEDGGTSSVSGIVEKDINLSISKKLNLIFTYMGYETLMIRDGDYLIYDKNLCKTIREKKVSDIYRRMDILNNNPKSVFLSIHQNHFTESKYSGAQVFYSTGNADSKIVAQYIQDEIVNSLQKDNTRQIKPSGSEIYLLYHAKSPAVMVECGFLSNREDRLNFTNENYQKQFVKEVKKGILQFMKDIYE